MPPAAAIVDRGYKYTVCREVRAEPGRLPAVGNDCGKGMADAMTHRSDRNLSR
jgi:hypothetical protein